MLLELFPCFGVLIVVHGFDSVRKNINQEESGMEDAKMQSKRYFLSK